MPQLNIEGKTVNVGDEFLKLSPEDQNKQVEEIASSLKGPAPVSANDVVRSTASGVPLIGGVLNKANAATNAALAPVIEPMMQPSPQDISRKGESFGERYRKSLAMQDKGDAKFAADHPVVDTAAKVTGGIAGSLPIMAAAPAAFGLAPGMSMTQMVGRGALSNAALSGADAGIRGNDVIHEAEIGGAFGAVAPVIGTGVGKLVSKVRDWRNPAPITPQNTLDVAGRKVPLTEGQINQNPAAQAEEEMARRGSLGERAESIAKGADTQAQAELKAADDEIAAMLDPNRASARTSPQDAAATVQTDLAGQEAARLAAAAADQAGVRTAGTDLATRLGNGAPAANPISAGEDISRGVTAARDAKIAERKAAYDAVRDAPGEFDPSVSATLAENIRGRLNTGAEPLWVDPTTTGLANDALKLIDRTVGSGSGLLRNSAAPVGPVAEAAAAAKASTPGGGAAGWQEKATKLADEMIAQGINPVRARAAAAASEGGPMAPHEVAVPGGGSITVAPRVMEAGAVKASSDAGYDAALQPRDRGRAASQLQIDDIASNLNPSRLGVSAEADRGAPIIGADGMVESGNGRVLALRKAYEQNGESAKAYRQWLADQGVDVSKYKAPILVRERTTPLDPEERKAFTRGANQSATLQMSAPERALSDAKSISPDSLGLIRDPGDLGAAGNRDFIRSFIGKLPQAEQGALVNAAGELSAEGLTRVRNAVLAKAYGDSPILTRVAEATSDDIKSISNALTAAAPEWAKLRGAIDRGLVPRDLDITGDLLDAVSRTAKIRAKGTSLESAMAQQDAFGKQSGDSEKLMRLFYGEDGRSAQSSAKIADSLRLYAAEAAKVDAAPGLGLLEAIKPGDILDLAAKRSGAASSVAADVVAKADDVAGAAKAAAATEGGPVGLGQMDAARKQLVTMYGDAKSAARVDASKKSDERAMARIMHEFDNVIIDAFDSGKFSGNSEEAKALLAAARKSHSEYRETFTRRGGGDDIGAKVEKILGRYSDTKATPDEIAKMSYGSGAEPGGGDAAKVAIRLKRILGENSAEWGAYKQGLFSHLTETAEGQAQRSAGEVADRIDRFLNTPRGSQLAQTVYSAEERAALRDYAQKLRGIEPAVRNPKDLVAKTLDRISGADGHPPMTLRSVIDTTMRANGVPDQSVVAALKSKLSPQSWTAFRQGVWQKLTTRGDEMLPFEAQALFTRLSRFLDDNRAVAKLLYSPEEIKEMQNLKNAYRLMIPMKGTVNYSNSATIGEKLLKKSAGNVGALLGFAAHGPMGALIGFGSEKIAKAAKEASAARNTQRLFFGKQPKAAGSYSAAPALVLPAAVAGGRR